MASSQGKKRSKRRRRLLWIFPFLLLVAVITAGALFFISSEGPVETDSTALDITLNDSTVYARMGKIICLVSTGGYDLLDSGGQFLASGALVLESPAVSACDTLAALYDIGGSTLRLLHPDGTTTDITPSGNLISVQVSENAYVAVVSETSGYRALVTVYDRDGKEIYCWYSATCWVLSAAVSPDNRQLAVLCLTNGNSKVKIFSLNAEVQNATFSVSDTILIDFRWMSASTLCGWSTGQALFFSEDGSWRSTYDFAGKYLQSVAKSGNGFLCFALSPYRNGSSCTLVSLDRDGNPLGTAQLKDDLLSLDAVGERILVLNTDCVRLYSSTLAERSTISTGVGCRSALLRTDGRAILIRAGFAELVKF